MDVEKLIEQLSIRGLGNGTSMGYHSGLFDEAATALSAQQDENEKLRAELEQVKRERKAAMNDIPQNCHTCAYRSEPECAGNKHYRDFGFRENCEYWQWRGPKEG